MDGFTTLSKYSSNTENSTIILLNYVIRISIGANILTLQQTFTSSLPVSEGFY